MIDKEFGTPDEYQLPEEFPVVKEIYTAASEDNASDEGREAESNSRTERRDRRMQMMYLFAVITSAATVLNIINVPDKKEHFDMDSFISSHRNWAYRDGEEFLYLGDDHWAYICRTGEDGVPYENTDFRRWRVNVSKIDEKSCVSYTTEWDWESLSMVKTEAVTRFVKKGDQYVLEVYERDHPNLIKRYSYAEPDKVSVKGSDDMKAVLGLSLQEIIEKHNTYRLYDDAPVYDDFSRIVFEPGGKGTIYKGKEKHPFTYKFNEEVTDNSINMYIDGEYTYAVLTFDSGLIGIRIFGRGQYRDSFGYFVEDKSSKDSSGNGGGGGNTQRGGGHNGTGKPSETETTAATTEASKTTAATSKKIPDTSAYISSHKEWATSDGRDYLYFGSNGWGYICHIDGGAVYKRFRLTGKADDGSVKGHLYEWNFNSPSLGRRDFKVKLSEHGNGYEMDFIEGGNRLPYLYVSPGKASYPDRSEMISVVSLSRKEIISRYKTFRLDGGPSHDAISSITFNSDGTGTARNDVKEIPFTYRFTGDEADNSMTIRLEGKDHYAFLGFDGGLISLRLFGTGPDSDHFGYFTAK